MKTYLLIALLLATVFCTSSTEHSESSEHSSEVNNFPFTEIEVEQKPVEPHAFGFTMLPGVYRGIVSQTPYKSVLNKEGDFFPANLGYVSLAQQRYQPERGQTVFVCRNEEEVEEVLESLPEGVTVSVRGGGHDFNNASLLGDVLIILSDDYITESGVDIAAVRQTERGERVVINPKARLANVYKTLYDIDPKFNSFAGSCPSVGVSGFALGGGHGFLTPWYGIGAHYLESVRFVDASGETREVDDESNPELMRVLRGGGHNLGVVTEMTFDFTSIPKHNWNYIQYYSPDLDVETIQFILEQYDYLVQNYHYEMYVVGFRKNPDGKISGELHFFAPAHEYSMEDLKNTASKYYPFEKTGFTIIPGGEIENKPWFELYMQDIPNFGSIGTEISYEQVVKGTDYQLYVNIGSKVAKGLSQDYKERLNQTYLDTLFRISINSYKWRQSGPFADKSVYLPYPDSTNNDGVAYSMWSVGIRQTIDYSHSIFEDANIYYPNYSPADTYFNQQDMFGQYSTLYQSVKQSVDPQHRFVDKFTSASYSHPAPPKN